MRYVKIETEDETRWVNLNHVVRVTLARHVNSGAEILAVYFASGIEEATLRIDGTSKKNAIAIRALTVALDSAAGAA